MLTCLRLLRAHVEGRRALLEKVDVRGACRQIRVDLGGVWTFECINVDLEHHIDWGSRIDLKASYLCIY